MEPPVPGGLGGAGVVRRLASRENAAASAATACVSVPPGVP